MNPCLLAPNPTLYKRHPLLGMIAPVEYSFFGRIESIHQLGLWFWFWVDPMMLESLAKVYVVRMVFCGGPVFVVNCW